MSATNDETARPGPADGSGVLVRVLAGAIAGLLAYLVKLAVAPAAPPENVLVFVLGGALLGLATAMVRVRRRERHRSRSG